MVIYAKVRRMFYREHLPISEIQRRTSLSRNTIKKWLKEPDGAEPTYRRAKAAGKLTAYEPKLLTAYEPKLLLALKADAHRAKRDRRTALMLFEAIRKEGYTGCYSIVTDFVRRWRNDAATVSGASASSLSWARPSSSTGAKNGW